jgi:hypothetical protein
MKAWRKEGNVGCNWLITAPGEAYENLGIPFLFLHNDFISPLFLFFYFIVYT